MRSCRIHVYFKSLNVINEIRDITNSGMEVSCQFDLTPYYNLNLLPNNTNNTNNNNNKLIAVIIIIIVIK